MCDQGRGIQESSSITYKCDHMRSTTEYRVLTNSDCTNRTGGVACSQAKRVLI